MAQSQLRFRSARPADAGALVGVKRAGIRDVAGWDYQPAQIDAWAPDDDAVEDFRSAIQSERFVVLVAEADDDVVGYGVLSGATGTIDAVYVHPEHTGRGVATSLVHQLEERARMLALDAIELLASLNARRFYAKLGYGVVEPVERSMGESTLEFVRMRKEL